MEPVKRPKGVHCGLLLACALGLLGCGKAQPSVVVYTSVDQVYAEPILKDFEQRTGIRILPVYDVEATKTTGLATRLAAEKGSPRADVFWNNEFAQTLRLKEDGVFAEYRSPSAAGLPPAFLDPDGLWAGVGGRARVFLVNTRIVQENEYPKSILDLLNPAYPADRIGIAMPLFGTSATQAAALYAAWGPEKAHRFFNDVKARGVRIVDGNSVVRNMVVDGQLMFGLTDTDDAEGAVRKGAPVKVIVPDQDSLGTLVVPGTVAMVRGSPHPEQAKALIDYLLLPETEQALMRVGSCQWPLRGGGSSLKVMEVGLDEIQRSLAQAMAELREVFVR